MTSEQRWRCRRAVILRARGYTYREIARSLGVGVEGARQIVLHGARIVWPRTLPKPDDRRDEIARALYLERMREFNRHLARVAFQRASGRRPRWTAADIASLFRVPAHLLIRDERLGEPVTTEQRRGFAAMSAEQRRAIAQKGGRAAHALGTAHEWTRDEARVYGAAGGHISRGGKGRLPEARSCTPSRREP